MRSFYAALVILLIASTPAFAGPFGLFGNKQKSQGYSTGGGCANGSCGVASSTTTFQQFVVPQQAYRVQSTVTSSTVPNAYPAKALTWNDGMPAKLNINGVDYFRH